MQKKIFKNLIIQLIKDDLKHKHTVTGLNLIGFRNDNADLKICISVFSLMGLNINDKRLKHLNEQYNTRTYHVTEIHYSDNEAFEHLATGIYDWLARERKKYKKLLRKT